MSSSGAPALRSGAPAWRRLTPVSRPRSVPTVRLVDADKEMLGVFSREDALKKAEEAGLDLVRSQAPRLQIGLGCFRRSRVLTACAARCRSR